MALYSKILHFSLIALAPSVRVECHAGRRTNIGLSILENVGFCFAVDSISPGSGFRQEAQRLWLKFSMTIPHLTPWAI